MRRGITPAEQRAGRLAPLRRPHAATEPGLPGARPAARDWSPRRPARLGRGGRPSAGVVTAALLAWDAFPPLCAAVAASGAQAGALAAGALAALVGVAFIAAVGGYRASRSDRPTGLAWTARLLIASTVAVWVHTLASNAAGAPQITAQTLTLWLALPFWWALGHAAAERVRVRRTTRTLIVGSGEIAARLAVALERQGGWEVVGRVDDDPPSGTASPRVLGRLEELAEIVAAHRAERILVAFSHRNDAACLAALRQCDALGVDVDVVPRLFELVGPEPRLDHIGSIPVLRIPAGSQSRAAHLGKRALDLAIAGLLALVTAPLLAAVALAVLVADGRPVLFAQERIGRDGAPFRILKFRTMRSEPADDELASLERLREGSEGIGSAAATLKSAGAARVTPLGRILRATSIDELPQLFNVLRGEMSIVGPRPLQRYEVEALDDWQQRRQAMRPGITGLWQVRGRSELAWEERMHLDYRYVRHWSATGDIQLLLDTLPAVARRRGAL